MFVFCLYNLFLIERSQEVMTLCVILKQIVTQFYYYPQEESLK